MSDSDKKPASTQLYTAAVTPPAAETWKKAKPLPKPPVPVFATKTVTPRHDDKLYVDCPHCGSREFLVGHLFAKDRIHSGAAGPWTCDRCGRKVKGFLPLAHGDIELKFDPNVKPHYHKTLHVMRVVPAGTKIPAYLLVQSRHPVSWLKEERESPGSSTYHYHYNDGTCPVNWLGDVTEVYNNGELDNHQVFSLLTMLSEEEARKKLGVGADEDVDFSDHMLELFPEILEEEAKFKAEQEATQANFGQAMFALFGATRVVAYRPSFSLHLTNRDRSDHPGTPVAIQCCDPKTDNVTTDQWQPSQEDMQATDWVIMAAPGLYN